MKYLSLAIVLVCGVLFLQQRNATRDLQALRAEFVTHQQNHEVDIASLHRELERLRADLDARKPPVVEVPKSSVTNRYEWANRLDRHEQRIGQLEYARYGQQVQP